MSATWRLDSPRSSIVVLSPMVTPAGSFPRSSCRIRLLTSSMVITRSLPAFSYAGQSLRVPCLSGPLTDTESVTGVPHGFYSRARVRTNRVRHGDGYRPPRARATSRRQGPVPPRAPVVPAPSRAPIFLPMGVVSERGEDWGVQTAADPDGSRLLEGKRIVVTGVATRTSIAFAVARAAQLHGAELVLTSFGRIRSLTERAARRLPRPPDVLELDVNSPADLERLHDELETRWGRVDGALHAIAYAPPDAMGGNFLHPPAESAEQAFRTSAYSLKALAAALAPLMEGGGSVVGLDFDAARAWPSYDWMGVSKAALEAVARYLARDLGPRGIRVNLVSAGPLGTVAARGIPGFEQLAELWRSMAPLGWDVDDPGPVARAICLLLSDYAQGI